MLSVFGELHGVYAQECCQCVGVFEDVISLCGLGIFVAGYLYAALFGCLGDSVNYLIFVNQFSFH